MIMLPVFAALLPKMLPLKSLTFNDVADVATFPTSYIFCSLICGFDFDLENTKLFRIGNGQSHNQI